MGRARGWTNEQAQAVLGEMADGLSAQHQAFTTELEAHPEIGGAKLAAVRERATRALDRFLPATTPDGAKLRAVLTKSGYGNFAPFVRLLDAIGASMSEDRPIVAPAGGAAPVRKPTAEVMFPSSAPAARP